MSAWTHIIGSMYVETYTERKNIKKYVEKILQDAPKVTGSEEDMYVFVNPMPGYNVSSWKMNKKGDDWEKYQTVVCITLAGDFRDRQIAQTDEEFQKFAEFIRQKFHIYYSSISIYDEVSGKIKQCNIDNTDW